MNSVNNVQSSATTPVMFAVGLLAAVVGGAVVAFTTGSPEAIPVVPDTGSIVAAKLTAIEQRLATLEQRPQQVAAGVVPERAVTEATVEPAAVAALEARIARLEQRAVTPAVVQPPPAPPPAAAPAPAPTAAPAATDPASQAQQLQDLHTKILDPRASEEEKVVAWKQLRNRDNAWNDAVVSAMTAIGLNSANAATRADVWRQANGKSTSPLMGEALMLALRNDQDATAREEAAKTLAKYLDQQGVRAVLEQAAQNDLDEKVKNQAKATLARGGQR